MAHVFELDNDPGDIDAYVATASDGFAEESRGSSKRARQEEAPSGNSKKLRVSPGTAREVLGDDGAEELQLPEEPQEAEDDPREKRRQILKIYRYKEKFPTKFKDVGLDHLNDKSLQELHEIEEDLQYTLSLSTNTTVFSFLTGTGLQLYSNAGQFAGIQCQGLTVFLERDKEWQDLMAEAELLYSDLGSLPLWERVGLKLLQATASVDRLNRLNAFKAPPAPQPADPDLVKEFSDL